VTEPAGVRRLLGVWAHPDDEAYLSSGLVGRVTDADGLVVAVCVSDGEAGFAEGDPRPPAERSAQRRAELTASLLEVGVGDVRFLHEPDGEVAGRLGALADRLAAVVAEVDPDLVVTFGPDGTTGHPDHVAVSVATTAVVAGRPGTDLWYSAKTTTWHEEWRELNDSLGIWMGGGEPFRGVDPARLVHSLVLAPEEVERKRRVLAAHGSQTDGVAALLGEETYRRWWGEEGFRRPTPGEVRAARAALRGPAGRP
jgi:LmbE family N-acetylglucosaminyl deacetylase